ncbi:replication initiation factor domain-containing protein [Iodobacter sp. CM08]|uniref:replication initiation factor domain-containing protein n=1 Tax=Iodobacter sp. CM08 TaxID=3085902 RepID=UPI002981E741|nr:replication initiation factor domain-containing protein [Iodobacter sp. CM08]MDW5418871.1 replication initiation factor domain-containing protein [Iodobacter sp. CM08]
MARKKALSINIAEITASASLKADDYAAIDSALLASADRRACIDRFLAAGYTPTPAFLAELNSESIAIYLSLSPSAMRGAFQRLSRKKLLVKSSEAAQQPAGGGLPHLLAEAEPIKTPPSNTGVTTTECKGSKSSDLDLQPLKLVVTNTGDIVEFPQRRGWGGDHAFVDWLNITVHKSTADQYADFCVTAEDYILAVSMRLEAIFGFGVTNKCTNGRNFYHQAYELGDGWGYLCIGGQRETILIMLNGSGCTAAKYGWEGRMHDWLINEAENPRITRVDCAYDDYMGENYSVDRAETDFDDGKFQCYRGTAPECEQIGNWKRPNGKGRTFATGLRRSGKYSRTYERGKKFGCKESPWVRIEVEFKSVDRVIPFDILLVAGEYLAASYPAFAWINEKQCRIQSNKVETKINYNRALEIIQRQYGHYFDTLIHIEGSADALIAKIRRDGEPKRLKVADYRFSAEPMRLASITKDVVIAAEFNFQDFRARCSAG